MRSVAALERRTQPLILVPLFFSLFFFVVSAALAFKTKWDECREINAAVDKEKAGSASAAASPEKAEKPAEESA